VRYYHHERCVPVPRSLPEDPHGANLTSHISHSIMPGPAIEKDKLPDTPGGILRRHLAQMHCSRVTSYLSEHVARDSEPTPISIDHECERLIGRAILLELAEEPLLPFGE
jgi:hypothetical protein